MPRTVSATEAKNRLGALIGWVQANQDDVIVETRGEPAVVIIPTAEYETLKAARTQARRREALARLEALRARVAARNPDLTAPEADSLADRFVREVAGDLTAEGKLRFRP
jgi:prevent-host-death family protein